GPADTGTLPLPQRLQTSLAERALLLVLDNFEQVLPAASLLTDLVASCPRLALLVTSRVPLQLRWEQTLRIAPLPIPNMITGLPPLDALAQVPAVALFVERARARRADFTLSEKQAPLVVQLVTQLDGLPLALELAAARLGTLSLSAIVRRLDDRLRLLCWEAPDLPERQQSLEAAISWSYDLLSVSERRLFRCLGVFAGRVSLAAITAVVSAVAADAASENGEKEEVEMARAQDHERILGRLVSLAEKSLVLPLPMHQQGDEGGDAEVDGAGATRAQDDEDQDSEPTFAMLETVREYAWKQLERLGELEAARRAHAAYFLALAERANPLLRQHGQRFWFFQLERGHGNLRAALRWLLDQDNQDRSDGSYSPDVAAEWEAGLRLAAALGLFWWRRGYHAEGSRWLEEALRRAPVGDAADAAVRTRALIMTGLYRIYGGELDRAQALLEEALTLAQRRQDPAEIAQAHAELGLRAVFAGEMAEATRWLHEARRRWEALRDPHGLGETLLYLGYAADAAEDVATAAAHYVAALQQLDAAGDAQLAGFVHCFLGVTEGRCGDMPSAVAHVRAAVRISAALRDRWLLSYAAQAAVALMDAGAAPAARTRLLGAADALAQATGATFAWEHLPGAQNLMALRERLAREAEWGAAYREGRSLPFGEIAALASRLLEEVAPTLASTLPAPVPKSASDSAQELEQQAQYPSALTGREQEVLQLVAEGLSSKAIGKQLFLAPSTVNYHLTSVFHKLGVDTRAQAVAVAAQRRLL
ncbi:MAG TPA: LuxR C-terminal-related transcriptional regulator, partial [Ktedonobacterales bacterium]